MIEILNNKEKNRVSGGWTCNDTHEGLPFKKVVWFKHPDPSKNEAMCVYQEADDGIFERYFAPKPEGLTGYVPGGWVSIGRPGRGKVDKYTIYECAELSASECILR